jgi:hypothetical protein
MTQEQDDITTMFESALAVLDQNNSIWGSRAAFADAVTRAHDGTEAIRTTIGKQQTPTTGVTEDKEAARTDLEDKLVVLANQISAYSAKSGDHDLGAQVEMTRSSVDRYSESVLLQTAKRVADTANDNLSALADYGVTAAESRRSTMRGRNSKTSKDRREKQSSGARLQRCQCRPRSPRCAASFGTRSTK